MNDLIAIPSLVLTKQSLSYSLKHVKYSPSEKSGMIKFDLIEEIVVYEYPFKMNQENIFHI